MNIKKTKDYSQFVLLAENRPVDMGRVIAMEKYCIENDTNFLENVPILVNSEIKRNKLSIIDGQHRFELSKRLDEPVYYVENNAVKVEHIAAMNTHQKNWHIRDYLNFYSSQGNLTYVQLKKISDQNPKIPITCVIALYSSTTGGYASKGLKRFKTGELVITDFSKGTKAIKALNDFKPIFKDWTNKYFITAIATLVTNPNYNHNVMMSKLAYLSTRLVRCPDTKSYIELLEEIYNYKNRDRINLTRQ